MPRGRYERTGGIWSSNLISHTVPSDGVSKAIYGKVIPPYVFADRLYVGLNLTGAGENPIQSEQEIYIHAGMFNLPLDEDKTDSTVDDLADKLLPLTANEVFGEAFDDESSGDSDDGIFDDSNVGITGGEEVADRAKAMKIFDWKRTLKFPESAVLVNADKEIRYKMRLSTGKRGRHISGYGTDPSIARMLVIRMITNNVRQEDTNANGQLHAWGTFTNTGDMANEFMLATQGLESSHNPPGNVAAGLTAAGASADINHWQQYGWVTNGTDSPFASGAEEDIIVAGKVSLYSRTAMPRTNNILYSE